MKFFEVFQNGPDRSFMVYPPANPTASHRFLVVGFPDGTTRSPGNVLLTTSKIVDARAFGSASAAGDLSGPSRDRKGRPIKWD